MAVQDGKEEEAAASCPSVVRVSAVCLAVGPGAAVLPVMPAVGPEGQRRCCPYWLLPSSASCSSLLLSAESDPHSDTE